MATTSPLLRRRKGQIPTLELMVSLRKKALKERMLWGPTNLALTLSAQRSTTETPTEQAYSQGCLPARQSASQALWLSGALKPGPVSSKLQAASLQEC